MEIDAPEQKDPFDEPYVRRRPVRILRRGPWKQYDDLRIWIAPNSTYADVKDQLISAGHHQVTVLQAHFGLKTFWNIPSLNCQVESTCQNLYALVDTPGGYLLGVVRTPVADCMVPIFRSGRPTITVLEAIIAAQPSLAANIKSIHDYTPNGPDIRIELLKFQSRLDMRPRTSTFPTVFFVTVNESIGGFLPELPPRSIPPILQLPFAHYKHLLEEANSLVRVSFRQQMNPLLQAAGYVLVAFAKALKPLFDDEVPDLEAAVECDDSLVELLPVVPEITLQLKRILDCIEQIINDIAGDIEGWDINFRKHVDEILLELCGDLPGAVVNRHSYANHVKGRESAAPGQRNTSSWQQNASSGGQSSHGANRYNSAWERGAPIPPPDRQRHFPGRQAGPTGGGFNYLPRVASSIVSGQDIAPGNMSVISAQHAMSRSSKSFIASEVTSIIVQHRPNMLTYTKVVVLSAYPFSCEIRPNEVEHAKCKVTPLVHPFITSKFCVDL